MKAKKKVKTKLFEIKGFTDYKGNYVRRFQDQLSLGKDYARYSMENGIMRLINTWNNKEDEIIPEDEYIIVADIKDMRIQEI